MKNISCRIFLLLLQKNIKQLTLSKMQKVIKAMVSQGSTSTRVRFLETEQFVTKFYLPLG